MTTDITNLSDAEYLKKLEDLAEEAGDGSEFDELPPTPPPPPTSPTTPAPGPQPEDPRQTLARISRDLYRDRIARFAAPTQVDLLLDVAKWAASTPGLVTLTVASSVDERGSYWAEFRYIIRGG